MGATLVVDRSELLVGGRWARPAGTGVAEVVSPTTEEVVGRVPESTPGDIDAAVAAARRAFDSGPWPRLDVAARSEVVARLGTLLEQRLDALVEAQVDEMGGTVSFLRRITAGVVAGIGNEIAIATSIPRQEVRDVPAGRVLVRRDPVGVVAGIVPWNGPVASLMGKLIPSVLSGCPVVLKPSPESPLSAYLVADAVVEAGFPDGVVSIVAGGREVGEHLVTHPGVDKVTFTGSSAAGARVAALCGEQLRPVTLELGGKSAAIVLDDADLDRDLANLVDGSMQNTGQVCYNTTRVLVPHAGAAELVERIAAHVGGLKVGDPHGADTVFGPLVAERQRERVEGYIRSGREQGARVVLGGGRPAGLERGWYVEPTVFADVDNSMRIAQEEIFGPVLCLIGYDTVDDAVRIANESEYGLGGAVFTSDVSRGIDVASRIETGTCRINAAAPGGGGGPFGGVKRSGLGREKGPEGYEGYHHLKSISLPAGTVM